MQWSEKKKAVNPKIFGHEHHMQLHFGDIVPI